MISNRLRFSISLCVVLASVFAHPAEAKKEFVSRKTAEQKPLLGEGSVKQPNGIEIKDIKVGAGPALRLGQVAWIHYIGWILPGNKEFDNSIVRKRPFNLISGVGQLGRGIDEALRTMKEGGVRQVALPVELNFPKGSPLVKGFPPNSSLKYEVRLVHVGAKIPKSKLDSIPEEKEKEKEKEKAVAAPKSTQPAKGK
ncbi:MAG: FKBP-type peptidyl-prolyl cis-trans isomerase [Candidatus Obscuribacterales bacterium]|nr:FKBP-type peptidyl-prolyl cis-trans isomerase [Candidatus Obscuribacterales bacterium]